MPARRSRPRRRVVPEEEWVVFEHPDGVAVYLAGYVFRKNKKTWRIVARKQHWGNVWAPVSPSFYLVPIENIRSRSVVSIKDAIDKFR